MAINKTKQGQQEVRATWKGIVRYLERELRLPAYQIAETRQSIPGLVHVLRIARALSQPISARLSFRANGALNFHSADPGAGGPWGGQRQRAQRLKDEPVRAEA